MQTGSYRGNPSCQSGSGQSRGKSKWPPNDWSERRGVSRFGKSENLCDAQYAGPHRSMEHPWNACLVEQRWIATRRL